MSSQWMSEELLRVLDQGVTVWNKWMQENPDKPVDFSCYNFEGKDFKGIDLSETYLHLAGFIKASLREANFYDANLTLTVMIDANFDNACLEEADLGGANLTNTNFSNATLTKANFSPHTEGLWLDHEKKEMTYQTELVGTNFSNADLSIANFSNTDLTKVCLRNANLYQANFNNANLSGVDLSGLKIMQGSFINANLTNANLSETDLREATFVGANLTNANFSGTQLNNTDFRGAHLCETNLNGANLTGCRVYGVSVWNIQLEEAIQEDLIITPPTVSQITVDSLEIAQFIYLLLNNQKIRRVIETITSKVVLILGRFTSERKQVLDAIRDELRNHNLLPVVFDFEKPDSRDLTETVSTLAHMARFIIVDLTDPSSAPHELASIVPTCVVPVQPLLLEGDNREYAMFKDLRQRYHWVLPTYRYQDIPSLLGSLKEKVIEPAEQKAKELEDRKRGA